MSFLYDEPITNFFHRISSKDKPQKARKRKRLQGDSEANTPSDKKPKVQQKLLFSNAGQTKGSAKFSRRLAKTSSLKRGESSESLSHSSGATPSPGDALSCVPSKETPTARHVNSLPAPLTAKQPALAQVTPSFLIPPDTDQPTRTPRPSSPQSSAESKQRKTTDLPTPVTMPRRATYSRAQKSSQSRMRFISPSTEFSSPEPSQTSSVCPLLSEYEESMAIEEGQRDEYYSGDESLSPPPSQRSVPSSQSQADGCFDSISLLPADPVLSTSRHSPVFLVPRLPDKVTAELSPITDDKDRSQTLSFQEKQSSIPFPRSPVVDTLETSLIEIHDGEEYVLSSQSQLVLPFHVSPRKKRITVSCSSSSTLPEDTAHSDEIIPSSQSQLEKELDMTSEFTDDRLHVVPMIDSSSLTSESLSQTHLAPEFTASFSEELSASTQVLVEETPEGYYDLPKDEELGSVTEEESGDEGNNMLFPYQLNSALTNPQESAPSLSQDSTAYPSSLPDTIKDFREMFGVGDGSYPDDFPMSLRD